jgi:C1A family cysteine protease
MALEMVDDPQDQQDFNDNDDSGGGGGGGNFPGGGGGGLLNFLPLLLSLFGGRGGKGGMLLLLLIGAGAFFLLRNKSCSSATNNISNLFSSSGYNFNPDEFKKANVYEGLEDDNVKNPLPEAVSLAKYAPSPGDQGTQGSCVAWSSGYCGRTILEAAANRQDPNALKFSPAYLYNNIALEDCQGSYIQRAMEFMQRTGAVPLQQFPYDQNSCNDPGSELRGQAAQYKIHGFTRLTESDDINGLNIRAVKEHLAKDAPVIIGMMVGGTFMQDMMGQKVWHPSGMDRNQMGFGGHAMCVIGYNDRIEGGAFEIQNSWGPQWGENGRAFVRYRDFKQFVREAYGMDPLPKQGAALNIGLECNVGLLNNDTKQYIPLRVGNANVFNTTAPIKKGTKFKIEIKNTLECYIYLFTEKADKSSGVLFPYKPIHSPYCGITGYRLFPRSESIRADSIGNKDYMGIIVSKQPIDYNAMNTAINNSKQPTYTARFNEAIAANSIGNVKYAVTNNGAVYFKASAAEQKNIVGCVVEIDKQ